MSETEACLKARIKELEEEVGALQAVKTEYYEIVEQATEIIFKLDASGQFYFVSAGFERLLGYTREHLAGKHFASIVHPDDQQLCRQAFEVLQETGKREGNICFRVKHQDGQYKWFDCSAVCLVNEKGKPIHSIGFAHDITQLKNVVEELRFSEERYRSLFEALGEGAVLIDSRGNIIASNRCAEQIFGVDKEHMLELNTLHVGRKFYHEDGSDYPLHNHPSFVTLQTGKPLRNMIMGVTRMNGNLTWISINTEPIYYSLDREKPDAVVASFADITQAKKDKEAIQRNHELYIEATKAVAQAVVDAQEKERAEIGYELHDNVNQILSTARVYLDLAKHDEKERLSLLDKSIVNISNAVSEIRRISRSLVPASLSDLGLILSIEDLLDSLKVAKGIKVEFYHSADIESTISEKGKLMLFRIIQEQVTNVLKHAEATQLVIEMIADSGSISLSITDNGKGFDLEKVKSKKGVGLRNIANRTELFNGKMNMVTSPGNGCKLNIIIPL